MRFSTIILSVLLFGLTGTGCDIVNPGEKIPTYVHIDSFRFIHRGDTFGTSSHKITHVWVYYDNEAIGTFEMPATIPIVAEGTRRLSVAPGIDVNGLSGIKTPYPFYAFSNTDLEARPGKTVRFDAETKYTDDTKLLYYNSFDLGNPFQKFNGDTSLTKTTDPQYVFEGNGAGLIYLNGSKQVSENISLDKFQAKPGERIYIEIDYRCSIPFQVGIAAFFNSGAEAREYVAGINPRADWNKIYINVQDFISANQAQQFNLLLRAGTDNGETGGFVAVDNIKIVSF